MKAVNRLSRHVTLTLSLILTTALPAWSINGGALALNSGDTEGRSAVLSPSGYVGTYITLTAPNEVDISVDADSPSLDGLLATMNIVIVDTVASFSIDPNRVTYQHTFSLPAGTHFVRVELINDGLEDRTLTIRNLNVVGATVVNVNSNANALAAADTYIEYFRKGNAKVQLIDATPGTQARVRLRRHAFNFGGSVHSYNDIGLLNTDPTPGSNAAEFQSFINRHFNMLVPSNAGKWDATENSNNNVNMAWSDKIHLYAADHNMRGRQHNLIWANQQPGWVNALLDNAAANPNVAATLSAEISERIDYYVRDRAHHYIELDVYNEPYNLDYLDPFRGNDQPDDNYWSIYGASGISDIFEEVAQAAQDANATVNLYVNEYNILQNGFDSYGNWYLRLIEDIENADGDPCDRTVSGVGLQYYILNGHSARYMQQVLQNMSVTGLPLTLSEFGVQTNYSNANDVPRVVAEAMRMIFGTPQATTFMYWGFWAAATDFLQSASVLVDEDWNLTETGRMYEDLLGIRDWDGDPNNGWTTDLILEVDPHGAIAFTGFYGNYDITYDGDTFQIETIKGITEYEQVVDSVGGSR